MSMGSVLPGIVRDLSSVRHDRRMVMRVKVFMAMRIPMVMKGPVWMAVSVRARLFYVPAGAQKHPERQPQDERR